MKTLLMGLHLLFATITHSQEFTKEFESGNFKHLLIANIHGDIQVEKGDEKKIIIKGHQEIKSKKNDDLPSIQYLQQGDTLAIYIDAKCSNFTLHNSCDHAGNNWGYYDWNGCHNETTLQVDFEVIVPENIHVILSTINEGDIRVENVQTPIWANNINGNITLESVRQVDHAHTINGDVTIRYIDNPKEGGSFYTLNGDIKTYLLQNLDADVSFKTFHGSFYTDFETATPLPSKIEARNNDNGFIYKLGGQSNIKINQGGVMLDFETFNGNVYLRTI
jgi:DUF4097 and DUF4098 domain-containing protein YvlB